MTDFPCTVREFTYDGFKGNSSGKTTDITAKFVQWTDDPGVGIFECSDGRFRAIPEFAILGEIPEMPRIEPQKVIKKGLASSDTHPGYASVEEILDLHSKLERGQTDSIADAFFMLFADPKFEELLRDMYGREEPEE